MGTTTEPAADPEPAAGRRGTRELLRQSFLSGVAVVVPLLVTLVVLGSVAETGRTRGRLGESFDEMSDLLLDSDTDSFQEVELVEYPNEGSYTVAFKTAETPTVVEDGAAHADMVTLFVPMAPNPVMGGFVIHVSRDRVADVDTTVEQGIRSIVTSGVAIGEESPHVRGLSADELGRLGGPDDVRDRLAPGVGPEAAPGERSSARREAYERAVSPEHSATPWGIIERAREEGTVGREVSRDRPATASGDGVIGSETEHEPAERAGWSPEAAEETQDTPAELAERNVPDSSADRATDAADEESPTVDGTEQGLEP